MNHSPEEINTQWVVAAVKLGEFSIGHTTVNQTCSMLMSTVLISFPRLQLVNEQRNTQEASPGDHSPASETWQVEGSKDTWRKGLCLTEAWNNWERIETGHCQSPGDIWSQARTQCQPQGLQGQCYLQVRWMHAGLAQLQAPSLAVTTSFHGTRMSRNCVPGW